MLLCLHIHLVIKLVKLLLSFLIIFYNDISKAGFDASGVFNNIADHSRLETTLNMLDACSNNLFDIWKNNASDGIVFLDNKSSGVDDASSVEHHFIHWCQLKEASGGPVIGINSSITWEQLDSSGDTGVWGGEISPSGEILKSDKSDIDFSIGKVSTQQLIRIVYELMLLNHNEKYPDDNKTRQEIINEITTNYPGFLDLPEIWNQKSQIIRVKKYIIMFYVMVKSKYSESDVNTGLLFD